MTVSRLQSFLVNLSFKKNGGIDKQTKIISSELGSLIVI